MENASEYEAPRMSIQTKDLIRYNNHITYYKKNHSDFIQKSHYNSTNRQQNPSIYFVRQPEIFSLFKAEEIARGEAFVVAKGHFPSSRSSPPATQFCCTLWGCVYVLVGRWILRCWQCNVTPIYTQVESAAPRPNISRQTTGKLSLSSRSSSAALMTHPTYGKPLYISP